MKTTRQVIEAKVARFVAAHDLLPAEANIVVAVSGGADSLCLLGTLLALHDRGEIVVASLDHGLRGQAGAADAQWVKELADTLGLRCFLERVDTQTFAREQHRSLEDAARHLRYAFLRRLAAQIGAERICAGHTLDDQAETITLNWLRGSGLAGLAGMRPLEGGIAHPLLTLTHVETLAYCEIRGWQPREDASNADDTYRRNSIRHVLLPILERYNPNLRETLARNADLIASDEAYLEAQTDAAWDSAITTHTQQEIAFALDALRAQPLALRHRLLRRAVQRLSRTPSIGLEASHIAALDRLLSEGSTGATLHLPGKLSARLTYTTLLIGRHEKSSSPVASSTAGGIEPLTWTLPLPGIVEAREIGWRVRALVMERPAGLEDATIAESLPSVPPLAHAGTLAQLPHATLRAYLDAGAIGPGPLLVRVWRTGDRFRPLGMTSEKKLQDYFADAKIPRAWRTRLPLVIGHGYDRPDDERILWVGGQRIDDRARLTAESQRVVALQIEPLEPLEPGEPPT